MSKGKGTIRAAKTVFQDLRKILGETTVDDDIINATIERYNLTSNLTRKKYKSALQNARSEILESRATQKELEQVLEKTGIEVNGQIVGKWSGITASGDVVDLKNVAKSATKGSEKLAAETAEQASTKPNEIVRQTNRLKEESVQSTALRNETGVASDKLMLEQELETNKASVAAEKQREALAKAQADDLGEIYASNDLAGNAPVQSQKIYGIRSTLSAEKAKELNQGIDKAEKVATQAADTAGAATGETLLKSNQPKGTDPSTDGRFKVGAGWVMGGVIGGAGLTYALMRNRGQQTNAQLYGQQPLY